MMELATTHAAHVAVSHLPTLRKALLIGRGGAAVLAATSVTDAVVSRGGGKQGGDVNLLSTPEGKSVLWMAIAMAFHYFGYSLARPVTVALFTSASTGYAGYAAAFPFAMAFVSPASLAMLLGYGNLLDRHGPQGALTRSTLICALTVCLSSAAIAFCTNTGMTVGGIPAVKLVTAPLFIFRESYVQLLTSQYWSFMSSVLTPNQSARWFGPIAGLTSIASVLAGFSVSPLVDRIGLSGALLGTGITLSLSLFGAWEAYRVANKHGFTPMDPKKKKKTSALALAPKISIFEQAAKLFTRVPVVSLYHQPTNGLTRRADLLLTLLPYFSCGHSFLKFLPAKVLPLY
jgi:MFS family permease